ncbi:hypothetical protein AU255_12555 [Methyloprofundus sedimenti]|uniref:Rieske domain-containing protein n=1 Tax=Methyloprofundus sedimenti TaxID=1420851 RepID=A0A1V8MBA0_9GAMM|nr:Rieske 2Fe-2S domain-containing protein [Methyloprofundus sedimenti]OQK18603.1 hypothetical protein AU255_12555 [Methyloprofundus sedimenti]
MDKSKLKFICSVHDLDKVDYLVRDIEYKHQRRTAIIYYYEAKVYAFVNYCMHMQRRLDCEKETIFHVSGKLLSCSMHGFVFEPTTGECLSPVCAGQKLQAIKLLESEGNIYLSDKHVTLSL